MKKIAASLFVMSLLTTACVPVVLVGAGAAAGGVLARDSRTLQTISDDTTIQYDANQKIKNDPELANGASITVTSFNRVVLLTGQVASDAMRKRVEDDLQSVHNIRRVYNHLQVSPIIGMIQTTDDATISANIRARMLVTTNLNADNFKYVVENKVVYLMGYATHEQTRLALNVIRNSSGVSRVVNLVEYKADDGAAADTTDSKSSSTDNHVANDGGAINHADSTNTTGAASTSSDNGVKVGAIPDNSDSFKPVTDTNQATIATPDKTQNG